MIKEILSDAYKQKKKESPIDDLKRISSKVKYQGDFLRKDPKLRNLYAGAAKDVGVDPYMLYTNSMNEGMEIIVDALQKGKKIGDIKQQKTMDAPEDLYDMSNYEQARTDNIAYTGLDTFGHRLKELRDKKYLPDWYKEGQHYRITPDSYTNETGLESPEYEFTNLYNALVAQAAFLKLLQEGKDNPTDVYSEYVGGRSGSKRPEAQKRAQERFIIQSELAKQKFFNNK